MQVKDLTIGPRASLLEEVFDYLWAVKGMMIPLEHCEKMFNYKILGVDELEDAIEIAEEYIKDQEDAGWAWKEGRWM